jgi:hypothetical protein
MAEFILRNNQVDGELAWGLFDSYSDDTIVRSPFTNAGDAHLYILQYVIVNPYDSYAQIDKTFLFGADRHAPSA